MDRNFASNDSILTVKKHHRIVSEMYRINFPATSEQRRKVQKLMAMKYGVIPTPDLLYEKHIKIELTAEKAILLSLSRFANPEFQPEQNPKKNTVFEDPKKFFFYEKLDLLISREPVRVFQVVQHENRDPVALFLGYKWAVFKGGPSYHFFSSTLRISVE